MGWNDNLAAADAAVAGYFDEQVFTASAMMKPVRDVNALFQPDPARQSFAFCGTIELDAPDRSVGRQDFPDYRQGGDRSAGKICLTALTTGWPWMPRQGDFIEHDGSRYAVAGPIDKDGTDRVVIWLNKAKT